MRRRTWPLLGLLAIGVGCGSKAASSDAGSTADASGPSDVASAAGTTGGGTGGTVGGGGGAGSGGSPSSTTDASVAGASGDAPADRPPATTDGGTTDGPAPASDAGEVASVHYYGRWDLTGGKAITVYSGAHVTARFNGTGISARIDLSHSQAPVTTVEWQIDGGAWTETDVKATMVLATGLPAGLHDVVFMARGMEELFNRWTPPVVASLNFSGFDVEGGALVPTARPQRLKIEFIGDSITEGVRVVMNDASDPWHTNGRLAYPCLISTALGAEWTQVGFGHQGLLQAGHGNVPVAADSFDWVYATVPRDKSWVADMVVLNQGTNDRDASSTAFRPAFAKYLGVLRAGYPQAKIFVLGPFGGYRVADIAAEVAVRVAAGDAQMFYVDTTGWLTAADFTEGLHPNVGGHEKATAALLPILRQHL